MLHYNLAMYVHAFVASYIHVHACKISMRVFLAAMCVSQACVLHVACVDTRVTHMDHLSCG